MGLLSKIKSGLIEEVPEESGEEYYAYGSESPGVEDVVVETPETYVPEYLIEDVYTAAGLSSKDASIFKVEEVINSLPKEMMTETKRNTVLTILGSFGLTATGVSDDGEQRVSALKQNKENMNTLYKTEISGAESDIEELKSAISELELRIAEKKATMKLSNEKLDEEISRVEELVKFICVGGEGE